MKALVVPEAGRLKIREIIMASNEARNQYLH